MEKLYKRLGIDRTGDIEQLLEELKRKEWEYLSAAAQGEQGQSADLEEIRREIGVLSWIMERGAAGMKDTSQEKEHFSMLKGNLSEKYRADWKISTSAPETYEQAEKLLNNIDIHSGVILMRQLAEDGYGQAQNRMGEFCRDGSYGVEKDSNEAAEWFRKAAQQGHASAQYELGRMYAEGQGVPKDLVQAEKWFRKGAEQGNASAQYELGLLYYKGEGGLEKNEQEALKWYCKAVDQNHAGAKNNLGYLYQHTQSDLQDLKKAVELYTQAAQQGNASGQFNLGYVYYTGTGFDAPDAEKAEEWFKKSAEQGHARAQSSLGYLCLQSGRHQEAMEWYTQAAEQGEASAQYRLFSMYYNGTGIAAPDFSKAAQWCRKAAEQGVVAAQRQMGILYEAGKGVEKDLDAAEAWYTQAAEQGDSTASTSLKKIKTKQARRRKQSPG